jgi:hypothetical protein
MRNSSFVSSLMGSVLFKLDGIADDSDLLSSSQAEVA